MDKFEYKASADEIKALIAEGEYAEAVKIADKIDWRRVRSVMMLCTVSDLYKINRRYQESKDILMMAYEKHPTGRLIIYSLCELCIKMGEYDQASEYYKEFVQIAPRDTGRYVLQYRLYEALDVSMEERIAILEEFKKREPREKWVYELAYLYHRIGLTTKCVEECDEMFLWFGEGRYVIKALELKALHQPLSPEQQEKYDAFIAGRSAGQDMDEDPVVQEEPEDDEIPEDEPEPEDDLASEEFRYEEADEEDGEDEEVKVLAAPTTELPEVKTVDVGQYNTINLQMALAESMKEVLAENEDVSDPVEEPEAVGGIEEISESMTGFEDMEDVPQDTEEPQRFLEVVEEPEDIQKNRETPTVEAGIAPVLEEPTDLPGANANVLKEQVLKVSGPEVEQESKKLFDTQKIIAEMQKEAERLRERTLREQALAASKSSELDKYLSQDYDGQISLVLPEAEQIEKQITGQLSIDDIMAEWEQTKRTNEEKRMENVRQRILEQTGSLFANFDEATKNGLLEELEKAFMAAIMKESGRNPQVKKVFFPDAKPAAKASPKQAAPKKEDPAPVPEPVEEEDRLEKEEPKRKPVEEKAGEISSAESKDAPAEESAQVEVEEDAAKERELSQEEEELFGQFVHQRKSKKQLIHTLDNMSLASCTGNIVITGEEETTTLSLAKALIREMQYNDGNFSGKVAKIEGHTLNKKDVEQTFARLDNGALIIAEVSKLKQATVTSVIKVLEKENMGLLALLVGTKEEINELFTKNSALINPFNLRVDIEPLGIEALVAYAREYAEDMEYSIDEFGILALHTRITDRQTSDHEVTLSEVRDLVDEAIEYANKKTAKHFMDILLAKRYDEDDMIILREKDFMHY